MPYHRAITLLDRRTVLFSITLVAFAGTPAWAAEAAGVVSKVVGDATAATGSALRPLNTSAAVFVDDLVKTGDNARLGLMLGERTTLNLGAKTELRIDRYLKDAGGEINLLQGTLLFDRRGKQGATDLTIKSPFGLIAVRGTSFIAGVMRDGRFGVLVEAGRVAVTCGGKSVSCGAGNGLFVTRPGARSTTPKPWSPRLIQELRSAVI